MGKCAINADENLVSSAILISEIHFAVVNAWMTLRSDWPTRSYDGKSTSGFGDLNDYKNLHSGTMPLILRSANKVEVFDPADERSLETIGSGP